MLYEGVRLIVLPVAVKTVFTKVTTFCLDECNFDNETIILGTYIKTNSAPFELNVNLK